VDISDVVAGYVHNGILRGHSIQEWYTKWVVDIVFVSVMLVASLCSTYANIIRNCLPDLKHVFKLFGPKLQQMMADMGIKCPV
jgi:hypothetical protein